MSETSTDNAVFLLHLYKLYYEHYKQCEKLNLNVLVLNFMDIWSMWIFAYSIGDVS